MGMVEEPIAFHRASGEARDFQTAAVRETRFDRLELNRILAVYGRMVAAGEWRDYALIASGTVSRIERSRASRSLIASSAFFWADWS